MCVCVCVKDVRSQVMNAWTSLGTSWWRSLSKDLSAKIQQARGWGFRLGLDVLVCGGKPGLSAQVSFSERLFKKTVWQVHRPPAHLSQQCLSDSNGDMQWATARSRFQQSEEKKEKKKPLVFPALELAVTEEWITGQTAVLEREWDCVMYVVMWPLCMCAPVYMCVCVVCTCIRACVWVCTPLLQGSGQTVHSCGGTQAKRL